MIMDIETRMANAKKIGSLIADVEMIQARVEFRTSTHYDREDILEALLELGKNLKNLQL